MHTLVIAANPDPDSLTVAVAQAFAKGAHDNGSSTRIINLGTDGFNPTYTLADRDHYYNATPMPADVIPYQQAMEAADTIAFVTPIYWYTMTASMKGFFDRVLCRDFVYDRSTGKPLALAGKTVRFIALTGANEDWYRTSGIGEALERQIIDNTFAKYCGVTDATIEYVDGTGSGDANHIADCLQRMETLGAEATRA
jgi:NAD(P)H dehydrogenase (quinone)